MDKLPINPCGIYQKYHEKHALETSAGKHFVGTAHSPRMQKEANLLNQRSLQLAMSVTSVECRYPISIHLHLHRQTYSTLPPLAFLITNT